MNNTQKTWPVRLSKQVINKIILGFVYLLKVKIGLAISEKDTYKDYMILYMYIAKGQGHITPRGQNVDFH